MSIIAPSSVILQIEIGSFKILKKTESEVYAIECAMMTSRTSRPMKREGWCADWEVSLGTNSKSVAWQRRRFAGRQRLLVILKRNILLRRITKLFECFGFVLLGVWIQKLRKICHKSSAVAFSSPCWMSTKIQNNEIRINYWHWSWQTHGGWLRQDRDHENKQEIDPDTFKEWKDGREDRSGTLELTALEVENARQHDTRVDIKRAM